MPQFGPNISLGPSGSSPGSTTVGGVVMGMVFMLRLEQYIELLINLDINTAIAMEDQ